MEKQTGWLATRLQVASFDSPKPISHSLFDMVLWKQSSRRRQVEMVAIAASGKHTRHNHWHIETRSCKLELNEPNEKEAAGDEEFRGRQVLCVVASGSAVSGQWSVGVCVCSLSARHVNEVNIIMILSAATNTNLLLPMLPIVAMLTQYSQYFATQPRSRCAPV